MPQVGYEPNLPVFEWSKTFHALGDAASVVGSWTISFWRRTLRVLYAVSGLHTLTEFCCSCLRLFNIRSKGKESKAITAGRKWKAVIYVTSFPGLSSIRHMVLPQGKTSGNVPYLYSRGLSEPFPTNGLFRLSCVMSQYVKLDISFHTFQIQYSISSENVKLYSLNYSQHR
jgi:hypothetical protein